MNNWKFVWYALQCWGRWENTAVTRDCQSGHRQIGTWGLRIEESARKRWLRKSVSGNKPYQQQSSNQKWRARPQTDIRNQINNWFETNDATKRRRIQKYLTDLTLSLSLTFCIALTSKWTSVHYATVYYAFGENCWLFNTTEPQNVSINRRMFSSDIRTDTLNWMLTNRGKSRVPHRWPSHLISCQHLFFYFNK